MVIHSSPHLSLWKSAAAEAIARHDGKSIRDVDAHPMIQGIDYYADAMARGERLQYSGGGDLGTSDDDPQILGYLSMLQHQAVHAKINQDSAMQNLVNLQRSRFRFGNPLWEQQWIQYFWYYWDYPLHKGRSPDYRSWKDKKFGDGDINYGVVDWKIPADATIALIGDIGTGTDIAAAVLKSALEFGPDLILHVGDIYYSGTPFEFQHRFIGMYQEVCRSSNIHVPMFTIPGNHEYFMGGKGFYQCLDSNQLIADHDQQQEASYFALRSEDEQWQFLAMDTSYYGHFMEVSPEIQNAALKLLHGGKIDMPADPTNPHWPQHFNPHFKDVDKGLAIQDTSSKPSMVTIRQDEQEWHEHKLKNFAGRTVLLSHHQLYSATQQVGVASANPNALNRPYLNYDLWKQFDDHFGDAVAAWFWGHEHSLGIYQDGFAPSDWPASAKAILAKGRCVGHSAIPVQEKENPYNEQYPVPLVSGNPKLSISGGWYNRGFQIMQLQGENQPMETAYYEVKEADPTPCMIYKEKIY